ncbi:MAG: pyridoxal phosphate-dependent decarboxylase family protein [Acidimicrobiales bacterium]
MHEWTDATKSLAADVIAYATDRIHLDPVPLDGPRTPEELAAEVGSTITPEGIGGSEALRVFAEVLAPACISIDHPRYFSFIPCAPTPASTLFDLVVSASSLYGGSWLEGAGAVFAENQALRWLADLAGFPDGAGGVFVQGGTLGNVSALIAARHNARRDLTSRGIEQPPRWAVAASVEAHSSITSTAAAMDVELLAVEPDEQGRLTGPALEATLAAERRSGSGRRPFAVVATAGTTNLGIVDDLAGVVSVARQEGLWAHVDAAYGGAGMAAPSVRHLYAGIEQADSFVVDPHKWLFAPFDCAALLYRDPDKARAAHVQHAGYLEPLRTGDDWSPSDYALHLTRRARGLPFWFSLACFGTTAYTTAIERTLAVARYATGRIRELPYLELVAEPMLSVVAFRRLGWREADYYEWSRRLLASGQAFVVPTTHQREVVLRIAIVNPRSSEADVDIVLDSLGAENGTGQLGAPGVAAGAG